MEDDDNDSTTSEYTEEHASILFDELSRHSIVLDESSTFTVDQMRRHTDSIMMKLKVKIYFHLGRIERGRIERDRITFILENYNVKRRVLEFCSGLDTDGPLDVFKHIMIEGINNIMDTIEPQEIREELRTLIFRNDCIYTLFRDEDDDSVIQVCHVLCVVIHKVTNDPQFDYFSRFTINRMRLACQHVPLSGT